MKEAEKVLKALASRRRLEILKTLRKNDALSVGEIADEIGLSFRSTSRHLNILYHAGVLEQERKANLVEYRLAKPAPEILSRIFPLII